MRRPRAARCQSEPRVPQLAARLRLVFAMQAAKRRRLLPGPAPGSARPARAETTSTEPQRNRIETTHDACRQTDMGDVVTSTIQRVFGNNFKGDETEPKTWISTGACVAACALVTLPPSTA